MSSMKEATIIINGVLLNEAQSSALRVAVASFLTELAVPDHMAALGEIGPLYQARLSEVQDLIFKGEAERRARVFAAKKHVGQTYNGGKDNYMFHLEAVHDIAESVGLPEEIRVAAYLHDVLEDTPVTYEELKDRFGEPVANLVEAVTGRGATRNIRNSDAHRKIIKAGAPAALLKLCDRYINSKFSRRLAFDGGTRDYFNLYKKEQPAFMEMIHTAMKNANEEQFVIFDVLRGMLEDEFK